MKRINSKQKGNNGEREFIAEFKLVCNVELKRNYDQTAFGGHDIIVAKRSSDMAKYIDDYYAIEVKRRKEIKLSMLESFWAQARKQALNIERLPILAYREDYKQWRMVLPILWEYAKTLDGTADMSLLGACKWLEHERKNGHKNYSKKL